MVAAKISPIKILLLLSVLMLLGLALPTVLAMLFPARHEVSFNTALTSSTCTDFYLQSRSSPETCLSVFEVTVGNTGTQAQNTVIVRLNGMPADIRLGRSLQTIVASARQLPAPEVTESLDDRPLLLRIESLQPNQQLQYRFYLRGLPAREQLNNVDARIEAQGTVISTAPRYTLLVRLARNVLGLF